VLALLALVVLPVLAQAETTYTPANNQEFEVPNKTTESPKPKQHNNGTPSKSQNPPAKASETGMSGGKTPGEEEPSEENSETKKSQTGGAAPSEGGGGNGGGSESSKSANNGGGSEDGLGSSEKVAGGGTGTPVAHKTESSGGGSSPVVPILIAVIVLAAISIGVVLYRQRKSGQGPDSRVSSSNAS
jgi:uncharacterized membrane protein